MIQAISACPATIAEILALATKIEHDTCASTRLHRRFCGYADEAVIGAESDEK